MGMYCAATAADCPFVAKKAQIALMACTALQLLLTAHLLPRRPRLPRWLPTSSVMEPSALEAAAHTLDGTAALMACTALPPLLTAHLLLRSSIISRGLLQK